MKNLPVGQVNLSLRAIGAGIKHLRNQYSQAGFTGFTADILNVPAKSAAVLIKIG